VEKLTLSVNLRRRLGGSPASRNMYIFRILEYALIRSDFRRFSRDLELRIHFSQRGSPSLSSDAIGSPLRSIHQSFPVTAMAFGGLMQRSAVGMVRGNMSPQAGITTGVCVGVGIGVGGAEESAKG